MLSCYGLSLSICGSEDCSSSLTSQGWGRGSRQFQKHRLFLTRSVWCLCLLSFRKGEAHKGVAPECLRQPLSLFPCVFRYWSLFWHNPQILQTLWVILSSTILKVFESHRSRLLAASGHFCVVQTAVCTLSCALWFSWQSPGQRFALQLNYYIVYICTCTDECMCICMLALTTLSLWRLTKINSVWKLLALKTGKGYDR